MSATAQTKPANAGAGAVLNREGFALDTILRSLAEPVAYEPGFEVREKGEIATGTGLGGDYGMATPLNVGGRKHMSHVANVKRHSPDTAVGKRLYAVMGIVALALTMNAEVSCEEAHMGLFSVRLPVIAILHGDLFVGEAIANLNRKGTIDLRSVLHANGKCFGSFQFTDAKTGVADMQCNDGSAARLSFRALSSFSGYGSGSTPSGPASFTFGLRPEVAALYLILPPGKKLVEGSDGLRLESVKS